MGDKRKRVDAPTVRPLNVMSLRTTVAQVDVLLAYAYRAAFSLSWSTRLLGWSAPTNQLQVLSSVLAGSETARAKAHIYMRPRLGVTSTMSLNEKVMVKLQQTQQKRTE